MSRESAHETWLHTTVRKKVKNIDLTIVPPEVQPQPAILWRPAPGRQFVISKLLLKTNVKGAPAAGSILLDNGTDGQNHVANIAVSLTDNAIQVLTVAAPLAIDYDHPLRIKVTAGVGTATDRAHADFIGFFQKISD
jgi:hypothetical protein